MNFADKVDVNAFEESTNARRLSVLVLPTMLFFLIDGTLMFTDNTAIKCKDSTSRSFDVFTGR